MPWTPLSASLGNGLRAQFCEEGLKRLKYAGFKGSAHLKRGRDRYWVASLIDGKSVDLRKVLKPAPAGAKYSYVDGNPLNLRLENITTETPQAKAEKPRVVRVKREMPSSGPVSSEQAGQWLTQEFTNDGGKRTTVLAMMRGTIGAILRNDALADEIHGDCYLSVLEQVAAGMCVSVNHRQFCKWCLEIARRQALKRQKGVLTGVIGDIEPDRVALKLKKAMKEVLASFSVKVDINGKQVLDKKCGRSKRREGSDHQFEAHSETQKQVRQMNRKGGSPFVRLKKK